VVGLSDFKMLQITLSHKKDCSNIEAPHCKMAGDASTRPLFI